MSSSSAQPVSFFKGVRAEQQDKYELKGHLGKGAYGEVWAATLTGSSDGSKVAIKKINNAFCQATEAKRILRELRILRHLNHPNVIRIRDILRPQNESSFSDLWVVFDFVDLDLRKLIASPQTISMALFLLLLQPEALPSCLSGDLAPIVAVAALGLATGYVGCMCLMLGAERGGGEEVVGMVTSFCLMLGLSAGSNFGLFLSGFVSTSS